YRLIKKIIPFNKRLFLALFRYYNLNYTILIKLSILCYYKIYFKIINLIIFNKQKV
ncbi:hypothetical protein CORC01_03842, partial [Colletotrichum orchidophilum]